VPRSFAKASSEGIGLAVGQLGSFAGASTVVAVLRLASNISGAPCTILFGGASAAVRMVFRIGNSAGSTANLSVTNASIASESTTAVTASDGWVLVSVAKATGTTVPRMGKYVYSTGTWTFSNGGAGLAYGSGGDNLQIGAAFGTRFFDGDLAAVAAYSRELSDSQVASLAFSLDAWLSAGPAGMWVLDQASTSMPVLDWTGGGANQSTITGTSVATASPPIGYGHPVLLSTRSTAKHLFTTQTPSTTNASDGTPGITTATSVRFAQAGTISGVRFFSTTTVSGVYTAALWSVDTSDPGTGTLLASKTMTSAPAAGTWNSVNFDSAVSVNTTTLYRAGVFSGDGRYVATVNFPAFVGGSGGLTNGDIFGPPNGDNPVGALVINQGTFEINASLTYPNDSGNATSYLVDVNFQPSGGGPVTHNADATLAATGTLTGAATRDTSSTATLAATGTLTGTAARATSTTATLAATGALAAAGERTQLATATLAAIGALTGVGDIAGSPGLVTLAATGGLTGTAAATRVGAVSLAAVGGLTATGDVTSVSSTATLSGTGALSATAVRTAVDTSLLAGVGALTGTVARATSAMATLAGLGALSATAIVVPPGDATSAPTSALRTSSRPTVLATVSRPLVLRTGHPPA
jgi:hypothetical protein